MKELLQHLPLLKENAQPDYVVDTCFLYWVFQKGHVKTLKEFCDKHIVLLSSFNAEEFIYHSHDVSNDIRVEFRKEVKDGLRLFFEEVPVHPGNPDEEKEFVHSFDEELLKIIPDPSDAVLAVIASKHKANILTRDKHHLFTTTLENYFSKQGIQVLNNFPSY